jgi:hypothetical protein
VPVTALSKQTDTAVIFRFCWAVGPMNEKLGGCVSLVFFGRSMAAARNRGSRRGHELQRQYVEDSQVGLPQQHEYSEHTDAPSGRHERQRGLKTCLARTSGRGGG